MVRVQFNHTYEHIISMENLLGAWAEFLKGKRNKKDVLEFQYNFMDNIFDLHEELKSLSYGHDGYYFFKINDPKPRDIHKATVRDRLLHHAIYRKLYPFFDRTFISDSYSCRNDKGTHRALDRFDDFAHRASFRHTKTVWVLKCDIRKVFASIDHRVLFEILERYIPDKDSMWLIKGIVDSFHSGTEGIGLPLGNLTSQLLVNIYMNEFDQFVKHKIKARYYIRYADDFVVLSPDRSHLPRILIDMQGFLRDRLKLSMHPNKISIRTVASGVDFLGWVHFPDHRVLRTTTKKRMFRNVAMKAGLNDPDKLKATVNSYLGMLGHGDAHKLRNKLQLMYVAPPDP